MRTLVSCCLFVLLTAAMAVAATPQMELRNETLVATVKGKKIQLPLSADALGKVDNADLRYALVSEDQAKANGIDEGIYIFTPAGKPAGFLPIPYASDLCSALAMSPGGTVLAVDFGPAMVREWNFYSWPGLKKLSKEPAVYFMQEEHPKPIWVDDKTILFTAMNTESGRPCQYDPCGSLSVALFNIADSKTTTVLQGTDLCDYTPLSVSKGMITVGKLCLPTVAAWEAYPEDVKALTKTITVPLP